MTSRSVYELRQTLETSRYSSPGTVKHALEKVYRHLRYNRDQVRDFFRECFHPLVTAIFGLDTTGMLASIAGRPAEVEELLSFLRPGGTFFHAVLEADAEQMQHYRLPAKFLSAHTQALSASAAGARSFPSSACSAQQLRTTVRIAACTAHHDTARAKRWSSRVRHAGVQDLCSWPHYEAALSALARDLQSAAAPPAALSPAERRTSIDIARSPGNTAASALPPPFLLLPLSTAFLVLLAHTGLTATEPPAPRVTQTIAAAAASPNLLASYASSYMHLQKPALSGASPHLQLITSFITGLLPQSAEHQSSRPVPPHIGARFLALALDMWLSDGEMPVPAQQATRGSAAGGAAVAGANPVVQLGQASGAAGVFAAARFSPPMILRTRCIKVRCSRKQLCEVFETSLMQGGHVLV